MKLEMGESLIFTWLRHVKKCQIVQSNWKPSKLWIRENDLIRDRKTEITEFFDDNFKSGSYFPQGKKELGQSLDQVLNQTESDLIGINMLGGEEAKGLYFTVEVAFHSDGLNYGSKQETINKVISKLIRTALCLYVYMGTKKAEVYFVSPYVKESMKKSIESEIEKIAGKFNEYFKTKTGEGFDFKLICNEEFYSQIISPIDRIQEEVDDTSELYLRSLQLHSLFNKVDFGDNSFSKKIIRAMQRALNNITDENELDNLQDAEYCRRQFSIRWPLLSTDRDKPLDVRYYPSELTRNKQAYYLCNYWTQQNKWRLFEWLKNHNVDIVAAKLNS